MLTIFEFILISLGSFRLTHLFVYDDIMLFVRKLFHSYHDESSEDGTVITYMEIKGKGLRKFIGEMLACHWCTGVWCAAFLYGGFIVFPPIFTPLTIILAIAGSAAFLETVIQKIN